MNGPGAGETPSATRDPRYFQGRRVDAVWFKATGSEPVSGPGFRHNDQ